MNEIGKGKKKKSETCCCGGPGVHHAATGTAWPGWEAGAAVRSAPGARGGTPGTSACAARRLGAGGSESERKAAPYGVVVSYNARRLAI